MGTGTSVQAAVTVARVPFQLFSLRANLQKAALSQAAFNGDEFLMGTGVLGTAGRRSYGVSKHRSVGDSPGLCLLPLGSLGMPVRAAIRCSLVGQG